jgi:hypothetical protein
MLLVTIDSNVLEGERERMRHAIEGLEVEITPTTVTLREHRRQSQIEAAPVFETAVFDESEFGLAAFGDEASPLLFELILRIVANGSFPKPGKRENLTHGERTQLRDAMILEAHSRDGRDVLVSNDAKAFIGPNDEKRQRLEALCRTKILTVDEFCAQVRTIACANE